MVSGIIFSDIFPDSISYLYVSRNIGISLNLSILLNRLRKFEMDHQELREILHFQFEVRLNYFQMSCYSQ